MSKKMTLFGLIGILSLPFLVFPSLAPADQFYLQHPGISFHAQYATQLYFKSNNGYLYHNDDMDEEYMCPVHFSIPDGAIYFIKSLGIRYKDNWTDGFLMVRLRRRNLYTGAMHDVATWQSDKSGASPSEQTASQGTDAGYKLIDT